MPRRSTTQQAYCITLIQTCLAVFVWQPRRVGPCILIPPTHRSAKPTPPLEAQILTLPTPDRCPTLRIVRMPPVDSTTSPPENTAYKAAGRLQIPLESL